MLTIFPQCNFSLEYPEILSQSYSYYHWLNVSGISKIMHCGILNNMPYCNMIIMLMYLSLQCQDTFVQFITFLSSVLSIEEFSNKLPTLEIMLSEYHIPSDAAFYLIRPMLTYNISVSFSYSMLQHLTVHVICFFYSLFAFRMIGIFHRSAWLIYILTMNE